MLDRFALRSLSFLVYLGGVKQTYEYIFADHKWIVCAFGIEVIPIMVI